MYYAVAAARDLAAGQMTTLAWRGTRCYRRAMA